MKLWAIWPFATSVTVEWIKTLRSPKIDVGKIDLLEPGRTMCPQIALMYHVPTLLLLHAVAVYPPALTTPNMI
jgi:hypothetical protein